MRYINGAIGVILIVLAALQFADPARMLWIPIYGVGSLMAFATLAPLPCWSVRVLAIGTTAAMFFYFAAFFRKFSRL